MSGKIVSDEWLGSNHYKAMVTEPFDVMKGLGIYEAYLRGAAIKYLMRAAMRVDGKDMIQDYVKAAHCTKLLVEALNENR